MNIYDVSERAGVSIATVSRVLNGSKRVSEATRQRVEQVMNECGYTPNPFARGLGLGSMKTVGLLCADFADPYLAQAVAHLEALLRSHGYDCLLGGRCRDVESRRSMIGLLLNKQVDGLVLVGSSMVENMPERNLPILEAARRIPVIILGAALEGPGIYSVFCDDQAATEDAVTMMLRQGCRRVLYLYHSASYSGLKKLQGYRDALAHAGIAENPAFVHLMEGEQSTPGAVRDMLWTLRRGGVDFDGVMTSDDTLALGAIKYAHQAGVSLPDELMVTGFNDSVLACSCEPELTSVDNCLHAQCVQCAATLAAVLAGEAAPKRTVFAGKLHCRGTTRLLHEDPTT